MSSRPPFRADQVGSLLAFPDSLNAPTASPSYIVEGIGYDFIPQVLSREPPDVDVWIKTSDQDAFTAVRALFRAEGLLVGGSSGSALSGALKWLKDTPDGQLIARTVGANVVVLLPDGCVLFPSAVPRTALFIDSPSAFGIT